MTNNQNRVTDPKIIPLTAVRKTIAERLTKSHMAAPHVTLMREIDVTALRKSRERLFERSREVRISYTDMLVKACAETLRAYPLMNSSLEGDKIRIIEQINIGIAVAIQSGLIVPVVRNADRKSLTEIAMELRNLVTKAGKGDLTVSQVTGGTFTITNLGMYGVDNFTPIINPPETAILGVGRIIEKPMVINGKIKARSVMALSLTFDHRVVDGAVAAQFLAELAKILEKGDESECLAAP